MASNLLSFEDMQRKLFCEIGLRTKIQSRLWHQLIIHNTLKFVDKYNDFYYVISRIACDRFK